MSPCWGIALTVSPVIGNLTRFHRSGGGIASKLFYQADRWSPIQVSRTKSSPVAYLTPELMGILWQLASATSTGLYDLNEVKEILQQEGIRSNHVHGKWTGVSRARWMDLLQALQNSGSLTSSSSNSALFPVLSNAPWIAALWEISRTKEDLLQFLLALQKYPVGGGEEVVLDTNSNELARAIMDGDQGAQKEWIDSSFTAEDLTPDKVQEALDKLLIMGDDDFSSLEKATAIEIICASRAIQPLAKPIVPNGRYGYDGGEDKPDCVEVTVREIINLLLWDESQATYDLSRLPTTTNTNTSSSVAAEELKDLYSRQKNQEQDEGQRWFDIQQNRPGCDYLSISPNGKSYELTPTLANVAKVTQQLLFGLPGSQQDNNNKEWTTLEELVVAWNHHHHHQNNNSNNTHNELIVTTSKTSHRPPMSDELVHEEHATLFLERAKHGITLKLDKAHAISTVTHIRLCRHDQQVDPELLTKLRVTALSKPEDLSMTMLCMMLMGDHGLLEPQQQQQKERRGEQFEEDQSAQMDVFCLLLDVLSAHFGPDRRELMELAGTSDLDMESKAHSQALRSSRDVLFQAITRATSSTACKEDVQQNLLSWLLKESPNVVLEHHNANNQNTSSHDPRVEARLLRKLEETCLAALPLKETEWAFRDATALAEAIDYKLGKTSLGGFLLSNDSEKSLLRGMVARLMYYWKLTGK